MRVCRATHRVCRVLERRFWLWQTLRAVRRGHWKVFSPAPLWFVIEAAANNNDKRSDYALWGKQAIVELQSRMHLMGDWIARPTEPEVVAQIVDGTA